MDADKLAERLQQAADYFDQAHLEDKWDYERSTAELISQACKQAADWIASHDKDKMAPDPFSEIMEDAVRRGILAPATAPGNEPATAAPNTPASVELGYHPIAAPANLELPEEPETLELDGTTTNPSACISISSEDKLVLKREYDALRSTCQAALRKLVEAESRADAAAKRWYRAASPYATPEALAEALERAGKDREDAERYRWLRVRINDGWYGTGEVRLAEKALDAAIDAARSSANET